MLTFLGFLVGLFILFFFVESYEELKEINKIEAEAKRNRLIAEEKHRQNLRAIELERKKNSQQSRVKVLNLFLWLSVFVALSFVLIIIFKNIYKV